MAKNEGPIDHSPQASRIGKVPPKTGGNMLGWGPADDGPTSAPVDMTTVADHYVPQGRGSDATIDSPQTSSIAGKRFKR